MLAALQPLLADPARIIRLQTVDSTNCEAKRRLLHEPPIPPLPPFLITTQCQTAGRGRGSNRWYSDTGSLIETYAFDPAACGLTPDREPLVTLAFAVCLIRRLEQVLAGQLQLPLGIRWPNDLEAGGRKWGGLLLERVQTAQRASLVLGVGLNLSIDLSRAPRDVARQATTLEALCGGQGLARWDDRLAQTTLWALNDALVRLAQGDPSLAQDWAARDTLRDQPVQAQLFGRIVSGIGAGIDATGRLRIATSTGVVALAGGVILREPIPVR
ncbi:MAG: biotin--[acetyl-CoA-carboxylase] ligase [Isosphaeraceae bacterium]|nr:MAG: biotin--[acetyl-CoA-carboxylase] ligase [Isosphaeraceae bacterium]